MIKLHSLAGLQGSITSMKCYFIPVGFIQGDSTSHCPDFLSFLIFAGVGVEVEYKMPITFGYNLLLCSFIKYFWFLREISASGWLGSLLCAYLPCAMHGLGACLLALKWVSGWEMGPNIYIQKTYICLQNAQARLTVSLYLFLLKPQAFHLGWI